MFSMKKIAIIFGLTLSLMVAMSGGVFATDCDKNCPPGLEEKCPPCIPPGLADKCNQCPPGLEKKCPPCIPPGLAD